MVFIPEQARASASDDRLLEQLRDARQVLATLNVRAGMPIRERLTLPAR